MYQSSLQKKVSLVHIASLSCTCVIVRFGLHLLHEDENIYFTSAHILVFI